MAKRFMFVCFGILALALAFHLGAQYGHAEYVDPSATGLVAVANTVSGPRALDENGTWWRWAGSYHVWDPVQGTLLPVPPSEVKFIVDESMFIAVNNDTWCREGDSYPWVNYGPPSGMTAAQPSTWGSIKAQFK